MFTTDLEVTRVHVTEIHGLKVAYINNKINYEVMTNRNPHEPVTPQSP